MFDSLKPAGKIAMQYSDRLPTFQDRIYRELNPENLNCLLNMLHHETRPVVEKMCINVGLDIVKSYDVKYEDIDFENCDSLCSFFWALTHGVFDPQLVTEDRLTRFCAQESSGGDGKIKLRPLENDVYSVLIAVKPL